MADDKKIIIDEDWKSRVEAEKEEANKTQPKSTPQAASSDAPELGDMGDVPMPPASLELLLTMLATEALVALGQVPHPLTQRVHIHRNQAQYLIDMIDVLRQKTKGNLTPDEQQLIEAILHQLRMAFIETGQKPPAAAGATPPADHLA